MCFLIVVFKCIRILCSGENIPYILQDIYTSCCGYSYDEKEEVLQSLIPQSTGDNVAIKVCLLYKIRSKPSIGIHFSTLLFS